MSSSAEVLPAPAPPADGELLAAPGSLLAAGERVARRAAAPLTRSTYLHAYRHFAGFLAARLGRVPEPRDLTEQALLDFRDGLEAAGRARATVAKELSALRRLAVALEAQGVDPAAQRVRANAVGRMAPRALTRAELERLLAMPDRRARRGRRDLAIMLLLGQAGLRRSEVCRLRYEDLEELRRHPEPRRRAAVAPWAAEQTGWVVHVRHPKRGRARAVDLTAAAVDALRAWTQSRPEAGSDHVFVSLARNRSPEPLVPRGLNKLVGAYAERAGLPEDRRTPHVLRHTFCTLLADGGQGLEVIAELAGHADVRTTKGYVSVSSERRARAVRETFGGERSTRDVLGRGSRRWSSSASATLLGALL
jgi:integrase